MNVSAALDTKWAGDLEAMTDQADTLEALLSHKRRGHAHSLTYDALRALLDKVVRALVLGWLFVKLILQT